MGDLYSNKDVVSSNIKIDGETNQTVLVVDADIVIGSMNLKHDEKKESELVEQIVDEMKKSNPEQIDPNKGISRADVSGKF